MSDATCPNCGSTLLYRPGWRAARGGGGWVYAGQWVCPEPVCRYKWDGFMDSDDGVLPAGVVARGKPTMMTEEDTE